MLSGGQKQKWRLLTMPNSPGIMFACQTARHSTAVSDDIMDVFEELNKNGHTVIIVTHDNGVAARCQRVIEIKDGECMLSE